MPPKARVGVRLKEAVNGGKSHNRSVDLEALTQRFNVMRKKLAFLVCALRRHHSLIVEMSKSRLNVSSVLHLLYTNLDKHWKKMTEKSHQHRCMFNGDYLMMAWRTQSQHHETLHGFLTLVTFEYCGIYCGYMNF